MSIDSYYEGVLAELTSQGKILTFSKDMLLLNENSKKVLFVSETLKSMNNLPRILQVKKCADVSTYYRNLGNQLYQTKRDYEAWQYYNLSLLYAPLQSENYMLALSNRSAIFLSLKKYKECLRDIDEIFLLGCPDNLKDKLIKRQTSCNKKITKTPVDEGENANKEIDKLMEVKGPKDDRYLCASTKLQVVFSDDMGRHVIAKEDIKVGETLVHEDPYLTLLINSQFLFSCNYCISRNLNLSPCPNCCFVLYCSEQCKENAWKEYHEVECSLMATLIEMKFTKLELLALRTVIKARRSYTDWDCLLKTIEEAEANLKNEHRGCIKLNDNFVYDSKHYAAIHTLATNVEKRSNSDIFQKSITAAVFLNFLSNIGFLKVDDVEDSDKVVNCVAGTLLLHLMTSPTNMHGIDSIMENSHGKFIEDVSLASASYAFHSLINHSCSPNVVRFEKLGSGEMSLLALRPIKKGMQIFDNYGSHHALQDLITRQRYLKFQYKFNCLCEACINNWPMYFNLSHAKYLPGNIARKTKQLLYSDSLEKLQIGDIDTAVKLFRPLCSLAEELEPYVPCIELADCQESLKQCLSIISGLIPFGYSKLVKWEEHFVKLNKKFSNIVQI